MKEVCIINYTSNAAVYGIGTHIKEYAYCLNKLGCKINLFELGTDKKNAEFYVKEDGNTRTIHFPYLLSGDVGRYNKGVCRLLRLYVEDSTELVFHFHYGQSDSLLDYIKKYFPLSKSVYTIHCLCWSTIFQGDVALFEKIIRKQGGEKIKVKYDDIIDKYKREKTFLERVDRIVCLSDDTLNLIRNQYGIKQNVWLIPNGLRKNYRKLSERQKVQLREKYYIAPEEKILLFVGRVDAIKGVECLMTCFDEAVKAYPNCRLVVAGNGDINEMIRKCKNAYTKVTFLGKLDKKALYQWYQIADVALFPSFYEECSYVGIEMMMHGLPVVASDGYSVKNMFHEGVNAKVARIENWKRKSGFEKNLKESILCVLNSDIEQSELRKRAIRSYQTTYSIKRMEEGYSEMLNSLGHTA